MSIISDFITIYSKISHRVSTWRPQWERGITADHYDESFVISVPQTTDLRSIVISQLGRNVPYSIIKESPTFNPEKREEVIVTKNRYEYNGELVELGDNYVTIIKQDSKETSLLRINHFDTLIRGLPYITKFPYIYLELKPISHSKEIIVSYLLEQCSWQGNYTAIIEDNIEDQDESIDGINDDTNNEDSMEERKTKKRSKSILELKYFGMIQNQTGNSIDTTETLLVSGDVSQNLSTEPQMGERLVRSVPESTHTGTPTDQYVSYTLGSLIIEEETPIEIFTMKDIQASKIFFNQIGETDVKYGYRYYSPKFLPQGKVNTYISTVNEPNRFGSFVGTSSISESREGDQIDMILGTTTTVKVETILEKTLVDPQGLNKFESIDTNKVVSNILKSGGRIYSLKIQSVISNRNDWNANVILRWPIGNGKVISSTQTKYDRKNGNLEFTFDIDGKINGRDSSAKFIAEMMVAMI